MHDTQNASVLDEDAEGPKKTNQCVIAQPWLEYYLTLVLE